MAYTDDVDLERDPIRSLLRDTAGHTVVGSHPLAPLLRRDDKEEEDPDPDAPPPPPPPPPVSVPDLAMQFRPCLSDVPVPPGIDLEREVISAVKEEVGGEGDVRYLCASDTGRIGIWLRFPPSDQTDAARARGVARIDMLLPNERFGVFVTAAFIKAIAKKAYEEEIPKRLDHAGNAKLDGPVHLTGIDVHFQFPNRIITIISGFDETPVPDVDFKVVITDTFRVSGGAIELDTVTDVQADRSWLHVLAGLSVLPSIVISPAFQLAAAAFITESLIIGSLDPDLNLAGAGGAVLQRIPGDVFIRGGQKLVPVYSRLVVTTAGVVVGGQVLVVPRDPAVSVLGPSQIVVGEGETTVTRHYQAITRDLRKPIRFRWTGGVLSDERGRATKVTFDLAGLKVGKAVTREARVRASDADNLTSEAAVSVRIFMTSTEDGPDLPPICKLRPWLPQCKVPGDA